MLRLQARLWAPQARDAAIRRGRTLDRRRGPAPSRGARLRLRGGPPRIAHRGGFSLAGSEDITVYDYDQGIPVPGLPAGYSFLSLEDENDPRKINAVLWKGFDHGPDPDDDYDCRLQMQSGPSFSKELTTIVRAPDGEYACYAGMWMDGVNDFAYLEPLATAPEHRGKGLATAALREGMRKTRAKGASYCIGGPVAFYSAIGFRSVCRKEAWRKDW